MFCLFCIWVLRVGWIWIIRVLCPTEAVYKGQHMANCLWFDDTCFICKIHKNEWVVKVQMLEDMT